MSILWRVIFYRQIRKIDKTGNSCSNTQKFCRRQIIFPDHLSFTCCWGFKQHSNILGVYWYSLPNNCRNDISLAYCHKNRTIVAQSYCAATIKVLSKGGAALYLILWLGFFTHIPSYFLATLRALCLPNYGLCLFLWRHTTL